MKRKFWSKEILNLVPYTPGEQPKINDLINFNTDHLRRYPDPESSELSQTLASYYRVETKNIFIGNGSDEVLAHAFMAFFRQDKPILMPDISYSFYTVYCDLYNIEATSIAIEDDFSINLANYNPDNCGVIFANPNAPTGKEVPLADIEQLLIRNTQSLVIVDEAYVDFGGQSAIELTKKYDNCLVIQTFSKSRSLAGLRIGFAIGHESLIAALDRVKNSFNSYPLDMLAQKAAIATIEDNQYFEECVDKIVTTRQWTDKQLKLLGFNVIDSKTNFIFASHPSIDALAIMQHLRDNKIIVRHFTKEKISNYLRITIGTQEDMQSLINSLQQLLK